MLLQRQSSIQHGLHAPLASNLDGRIDPLRMRRRLLDNVIAGLSLATDKQGIVMREIGVSEHMRCNQAVFLETVTINEISAVRIAWEHDFEDLRVPHLVLHHLVDPAHPEKIGRASCRDRWQRKISINNYLEYEYTNINY